LLGKEYFWIFNHRNIHIQAHAVRTATSFYSLLSSRVLSRRRHQLSLQHSVATPQKPLAVDLTKKKAFLAVDLNVWP
jgi:hypothetical protein